MQYCEIQVINEERGVLMKFRSYGIWILVITILISLSGCSGSNASEKAIDVESKEDIYAELQNVTYNEEEKAFNVEYKTNIPAGIDVNIKLSTIEKGYIGTHDYTLGKEESTEFIQVKVDDSYSDNLSSGSFYIELTIQVADMTNDSNDINKKFLVDALGGTYEEVSAQYKGDKSVSIRSYEGIGANETRFYLFMKSNKITHEIKMVYDIPEQAIASEKSTSSTDFLEYTTGYYQSFKNELDLIASNFEILAMDGFANENIVFDLKTWTTEFNELLDVYENRAHPTSEMEVEIYRLTLDMISQQRLANENILKGLTEYNGDYFYTAEEHLNVVTEKYLEGYEQLN